MAERWVTIRGRHVKVTSDSDKEYKPKPKKVGYTAKVDVTNKHNNNGKKGKK